MQYNYIIYIMQNIEIDFVDYEGSKDFQVLAEFTDQKTCDIHVKRLDTLNPNEGWSENLHVFLNDDCGNTVKICIGPQEESNLKIVTIQLPDAFSASISNNTNNPINERWYPSYNPLQNHYIRYISLHEFNDLFQTDIKTLPSSIFAIGIKDGAAYKHHDGYGDYPWTYEIDLTLNHIISVAYNKTPNRCPDNFYCLLCAHDGYMEGYYPSQRNIPKIPEPDEYRNKVIVHVNEDEPNVYPLLHKNKYILAQSIHPDTAYTIAVPDRYYFCLNRYNLYHSIHRGLPFKQKIPQIVFACNPRGNKYNFTKRRDIDVPQRVYFQSDQVPKDNIHAPSSIDRHDMIKYKYVLDIDGNASTWDATAWKLNSGSVIFKTDSNWAQWFYADYHPWIHYIPVADDFADIQERFHWCEQNPEKCEEMIKNCKELFQQIYRHHNVIKYTENLLDIISQSTT